MWLIRSPPDRFLSETITLHVDNSSRNIFGPVHFAILPGYYVYNIAQPSFHRPRIPPPPGPVACTEYCLLLLSFTLYGALFIRTVLAGVYPVKLLRKLHVLTYTSYIANILRFLCTLFVRIPVAL